MYRLNLNILLLGTAFFVASLSFVEAAKAEAPSGQTKLRTIKEILNDNGGATKLTSLAPEERKWAYSNAIGTILKEAGDLPPNSPLLAGIKEYLAQQIKTIPTEFKPNLQEIVYSEYVYSLYNDPLSQGNIGNSLTLEQLGYQQPKDENFIRKFRTLNTENIEYPERHSITSLNKILAAIEDSPSYLRSHMVGYIDSAFMDPKHFDTITKWALDHLDDQGKALIASVMLINDDFESPSNLGYLQLLKNNKKNYSRCFVLDKFTSLKSSGALASIASNGAARVNLANYLESLPDEVSCDGANGKNSDKKIYHIKDEIFSLGALTAQNAVQTQRIKPVSPDINSVQGCRFTESHLKEPVLKFLNALPQSKNTARQTGFFSSENSLCHLEITGQRVNKPTGDDMFNVEMKYRVNSELVPVPIKNPLTKAQVLDLAKAWSESQKTGAALAKPPAKAPPAGAK